MLSVAAIRGILQCYNLNASDVLCEQVRSYIELLLRWNKRLSLTSVATSEEIVKYHFAESFLATAACQSIDGRLADVGSGAGFPGLALKMYVPSLRVSLIGSDPCIGTRRHRCHLFSLRRSRKLHETVQFCLCAGSGGYPVPSRVDGNRYSRPRSCFVVARCDWS